MSGDVTSPSTSSAISPTNNAGATAEPNLLNSPPQCWGCHKPIDGGSAIQFADGVWHIECFQCTTCSKVIEFDSNLLFLADGKPICPECSYCCSLCKKPIFDEAIVTVEGTYHSECFRCTNCKQRIQGKSFAKTSQGIIYCVGCYAERRERKKAARRRREHQVMEEKMLPSLPVEAADDSVKSPESSTRSSEPPSASSNNTSAQTPLTSSTVSSLQSSKQTTTTISNTLSPSKHALGDSSDSKHLRHVRQQSQDLKSRRRGVHNSADFSASTDTQDPSGLTLPLAARGSSAGSTLQATRPTVNSGPPTPVKTDSDIPAAALSPTSPTRPNLLSDADNSLELGLAWTEDIDALENNFVRFSMRTPLVPKHPAPHSPEASSKGAKQDVKQRRREAEFGNSPRPGSHYQPETRSPLNRSTSIAHKQQRMRSASSASAITSMVPPGLRSSRENSADNTADKKEEPSNSSVVTEDDDSSSVGGGKEWLSTATVKQLKEELLVNYGQLCRMEASYQKLRDLYASVIDQLLETREALHQERNKRQECENILRNYYGHVPGDGFNASDSAAAAAAAKHGTLRMRGGVPPPTVLAAGAAAAQTMVSKQQARGQIPKIPVPQQQREGQSSMPSMARQPSLRRQRQARKNEPAAPANHNDSGSDDDDAIITTVPQKATKRFIWPFGGSRVNGDDNTSGAHNGHDHHDHGDESGILHHSFHQTSTFRGSKCDHCSERFKTFTNNVVRCRNCGFVCHQRCVADVTASCMPPDNATGRGTRHAGGASTTGNNAMVFDPNVPFQADKMFGRDLCEQAALEGQSVPWVVRAAVEFIEAEGLTMEGVYRRSGSTMDIRAVQMDISRVAESTNNKFFDAPITTVPGMDVTNVTSVLKQYFRDLPNPLMTSDTYLLWVQAANIASVDERIKVYRTISDSMPEPHSETLKYLMKHLKRIADNQQENKMTTNNLSVVFAPNILHMSNRDVLQEMANMSGINKTVSFLIQHAEDVWGESHYEKYVDNSAKVQETVTNEEENTNTGGMHSIQSSSESSNTGSKQTTGSFVLPPMMRRQKDISNNMPGLSIPNQNSKNRDDVVDGQVDGNSSLSHSMPSPKGMFFSQNEPPLPSERLGPHHRAINNGNGVYQKTSFDLPRNK